jgi:5-methylcytosine-specific restriction protein A
MPNINRRSRPAKWIAEKKPHTAHASDNYPFYNSKRWRKVSSGFRQCYPLCEICEEAGLVVAAQCVDHIKPISQGGDKWSWANLQSLCNSCHARKSGREAHQDGL